MHKQNAVVFYYIKRVTNNISSNTKRCAKQTERLKIVLFASRQHGGELSGRNSSKRVVTSADVSSLHEHAGDGPLPGHGLQLRLNSSTLRDFLHKEHAATVTTKTMNDYNKSNKNLRPIPSNQRPPLAFESHSWHQCNKDSRTWKRP
jgi:hypothetical protein